MNKDNYNKYMREYYHKKKSDSEYISRKREAARKAQAKRKEAVSTYKKEYRAKNKDKIALYMRDRRKTNINAKLSDNLRCRLKMAMRSNAKKGSAVKLLGCSIEDFKIYLSSLFKPGMTWDNYGDWHIDHKKPLSRFDLTDETQLAEACHWTNLQPLWASENSSKGNRV